MPLPKPEIDETQDEFMSRCTSNSVMKSEYPDDDDRQKKCALLWAHPGSKGGGASDKIGGGHGKDPAAVGGTESKGDGTIVRLSEITATELSASKVDAKSHSLFDVAVLSETSRNGRTYSKAARDDAVKVFEGARVFMEHRAARGRRREAHPVTNYIGRLQGLSHGDDGVVRARRLRVVNNQHWPLLSGIARGDPSGVGLSIDGDGEVKNNVVTRLVAGYSVDVVSDPAATKSLFENSEVDMTREELLEELTLEDLRAAREDLVGDIESALTKEKDKKISELRTKLKKLEVDAKKKEAKPDDADATESVDSKDVLRAVIESGVQLTAVEIKAVESFEDMDDVKAYLDERKKLTENRGSARSKGKTNNGKTALDSKALRAAMITSPF